MIQPQKQKARKNRGFTLLELLVVVAIIGLLSAIVISSLEGFRMKARDAKRIADLQSIRKALELYYAAYGTYPLEGGWYNSSDFSWNYLATALQSFISPLPKDPINNLSNPWGNKGRHSYAYIHYAFFPDEYDLVTQLEDKENPNRCELKCWLMHTINAPNTASWCASTQCPNEITQKGFSLYLLADH